MTQGSADPPVALVVPTIDRPAAVQRLVRSARRRFPTMSIYVGDQGAPDPFMSAFYAGNGVRVVRLPYDCGVSEARNQVVEQVTEELFLLCDDDFVITEETEIRDAIRILRLAPEIGVVGGHLSDAFTGRREVSLQDRFYEMVFLWDRDRKTVISLPIHLAGASPRLIDGIVCYPCDAVLNFALFRRTIFSADIHWDSLFKSDGEHEDFYLNLKLRSSWSVVYLPTMTAQHERPPTTGYQRKRERTGGWSLMMKKWSIGEYLELGAGLRTLEEVGAFHPEAQLSKELFYSSRSNHYDGYAIQGDGVVLEVSAVVPSIRPLFVETLSPPNYSPLDLTKDGISLASHEQMRRAEESASPDTSRLTIVVTTIDRPNAIQRFVRSVRRRFPEVAILVGNQSDPDPFLDQFLALQGAEVVRLRHDAGLSVTRNELIARVTTQYFVLCDDDFIFTDDTDFSGALSILDGRADINIVGGRLWNIEADGERRALDWAMKLFVDRDRGLLAYVPLHYFSPKPQMVRGQQFYPCEAVLNFAVFRSPLPDALRWDDSFKGDGEHEDFYLSRFLAGDAGVVFLPTMTAEHERPATTGYERRRAGADGWHRLFRKWGLRDYLEVGTGLRSDDEPARLIPQRNLTRARFYGPTQVADPAVGLEEVSLLSRGTALFPLHLGIVSARRGPVSPAEFVSVALPQVRTKHP